MSASLVGSEMCIRDRASPKLGIRAFAPNSTRPQRLLCCCHISGCCSATPVSYTHLTLPTICSV
eukprot:1011967-Alexandrium_andersonii.AAC.1